MNRVQAGRLPLLLGSVYAAAVWSFVFAALSFYWALGGNFLLRTQSPQIVELTANTWFLAVVWLTGLLKVTAGFTALSLVQRWGKRVPVWLRQTANWGIGLVLTFYGGANLAARGLMALGMLETPPSMCSAAARWHLVLWDPWFFLGGVLFLAAAWRFGLLKRRLNRAGVSAVDAKVNL